MVTFGLSVSRKSLAESADRCAVCATRVRIDYRRPARLDDELSVTCEPRAVGAASVVFAQNIIRVSSAARTEPTELPGAFDPAPGVLTQAEVRIACLDARTFRPLRTPEFLLSAFAAQENIQVHGGIGVTWEANCHLFYRRARLNALLLGPRHAWQDRLVASLEQKLA